MHTHASLLEHQRILNEIRGLAAHDKLFCNSPFFWVGGIAFAVLATLLAGSTLICSNATDAGETLDLLEAEKPTMTNGFVAGHRPPRRVTPACRVAICPRCAAETCTRSWRPRCDRPIRSCGTPCSA